MGIRDRNAWNGLFGQNAWTGLFGRSGGVGYHLAAAVYARGLWAPFRAAISAELGRRNAGGDRARMHLVVIGASGGYSLEPSFLRGFGAVTVVDIDPLAGMVFRRRVGRAGPLGGRVNFIRQDFFSALGRVDWSLERWWGAAVSGVGGSRGVGEGSGCEVGEHSVETAPVFLFSNLLGQLQYLFEGVRLEEVSLGLTKAMRDVNWISYHDRLSVAGSTQSAVPLRAAQRLSTEEVARHFSSFEVEEHEMGEWIEKVQGEFTYLPWRLTTRRTQIIEVCGSFKGAE